jgi:hypothetical protein
LYRAMQAEFGAPLRIGHGEFGSEQAGHRSFAGADLATEFGEGPEAGGSPNGDCEPPAERQCPADAGPGGPTARKLLRGRRCRAEAGGRRPAGRWLRR